MKRVGYLWPAVLERGNLLRAFHQAARGKRHKPEVQRFSENLDAHLERLRCELESGRFETGHYTVFKVYDPKERTIHAARFVERVFHHALMNVCEPVLERQAIFHSYACRKGKGRLKAIAVAQRAARRHAWHLKLDIRKYFESIPHEQLAARLQRVFKDPELLYWLNQLIRGHRGAEGKGLPIGSLTSQHLANFYLGPLDRRCQGFAGVRAYARYMDDFVCWADTKADLIAAGREIHGYVEASLGLELKHPPSPQRSARGMDFLGYRIFPTHAELNRRSKRRYQRRLSILGQLHSRHMISESRLQQRLTAATAFCLPVRSHGFRLRAMETNWARAIGLQPCATGRQLEQQRQQLPGGKPQQQQPEQLEQQQRVPGSPQLRPELQPDRAVVSMGLNRPVSGSRRIYRRDEVLTAPLGASRAAAAAPKAPSGDLPNL